MDQTERGTNTMDGEREKRTEAKEWTQWRQKTNRRKGEVVERETRVEVEAKSAAAGAWLVPLCLGTQVSVPAGI